MRSEKGGGGRGKGEGKRGGASWLLSGGRPCYLRNKPTISRRTTELHLYYYCASAQPSFFYRAMHFSANARSWDRTSSVRLSVCNVGGL